MAQRSSSSGLVQSENLSVPCTLLPFSPAVTSKMHMKCKSTMKSIYCKPHTLARDFGTYRILKSTFAPSLWNVLLFKSVGPFNMSFQCQMFPNTGSTWTRSVAIPIIATFQLPKFLHLWLTYISLHDFNLKLRLLSEEPAPTPRWFWLIIYFSIPWVFTSAGKIQLPLYNFLHAPLWMFHPEMFPQAIKEAQSWWNQQWMKDPYKWVISGSL